MSNVEVARGLYDAFGRGDLDAVRAAMAADVRWIEPESLPYGTQVGFDAILQNVLAVAVSEIEGFGARPEQWIDGGDAVVALGHYEGRSIATGRDLDVSFAHVLRFDDGLLTELRVYADTHRWLESTGDTAVRSSG